MSIRIFSAADDELVAYSTATYAIPSKPTVPRADLDGAIADRDLADREYDRRRAIASRPGPEPPALGWMAQSRGGGAG